MGYALLLGKDVRMTPPFAILLLAQPCALSWRRPADKPLFRSSGLLASRLGTDKPPAGNPGLDRERSRAPGGNRVSLVQTPLYGDSTGVGHARNGADVCACRYRITTFSNYDLP